MTNIHGHIIQAIEKGVFIGDARLTVVIFQVESLVVIAIQVSCT